MVQTDLVKQFVAQRDALFAFLFALTRSYDVAEEVFQEVSVTILEEAARGTQVGHFMAWAREIGRRRVAQHYRKAVQRPAPAPLSESLTEVICQAFNESDDRAAEEQVRMQYLLACLQQLTERSRQMIQRFYHQRQSLKEIGAALGWQAGSVKVALSRARKVLADCIQVRQRLQAQGAE